MSRCRVVVRVAGPDDAPLVAGVVAAVRAPGGSAERPPGGALGRGPGRAPARPERSSAGQGSGAPAPAADPVEGDVLVLAEPGDAVAPADPAPGGAAAADEGVVAEALRRPDVVVLLAEAGGRAVGVLVLRRGEVLPLSDLPAAHVDQLAVAPAERRRGVGRALLAAAARAADADGLQRIVVAAPPGGREAHRFLARLGFAPLVVQRCASVPALRRSLRAQSARRASAGGDEVSQQAAVERLLTRRRRERGLTGTA